MNNEMLTMLKKTLYCLILCGCLIGALCFYFSMNSSKANLEDDCALCHADVVNRQSFYEDDLVLALYTHKPILPGHCLIIPKRHVERFEMMTDEEILQVGRVIKKVNQAALHVFGTSPYLILQKNGYEVGQTVPHVHFHYIPREEGDDSILKFLFKMFITNLQAPLPASEIQPIVKQMCEAMQKQDN